MSVNATKAIPLQDNDDEEIVEDLEFDDNLLDSHNDSSISF
jgi:hypothetical protein